MEFPLPLAARLPVCPLLGRGGSTGDWEFQIFLFAGIAGIAVLVWIIKAVSAAQARTKQELAMAEWRLKRERERISRHNNLFEKYQNQEIVDLLMSKTLWVGETEDQVTDSLGLPEDQDRKVLKNKVKTVLKYYSTGRNRYSLRVTLEDGLVVGWDDKGMS